MPPRVLPAVAPARGADPADAPAPSWNADWGLVEYAVSFVYYMAIFGAIAGLVGSRLPVHLGIFLFFINDTPIEWVLRKAGVRVVPDSLGETFIRSFVWFAGLSILTARWHDAAPAWLATHLLPNASWPAVAGLALVGAVFMTAAATFVRRVLPWVGIEMRRDSLAWITTQALVAVALLELAYLVLSSATVSGWLASL
jgi:hypothetical protein